MSRPPLSASDGKLQLVCGWHAVWAVYTRRPAAILRLHYDPTLSPDRLSALAPLLRDLAARRQPYRATDAEGLAKLAGTTAHQGLVAVCAPRPLPLLQPADVDRAAATPGLWLALDGVSNPHNVGALARTAAFFGVQGLWLAGQGAITAQSAAAARVAEGGLESLALAHAAELGKAVQRFATAGGRTVALSVHASQPLATAAGLARRQAVLLVCGAEESGLRPEVEQLAQHRLHIPGATPAAVESLNVGAATAIALAVLLG